MNHTPSFGLIFSLMMIGNLIGIGTTSYIANSIMDDMYTEQQLIEQGVGEYYTDDQDQKRFRFITDADESSD